MALQHFLFAAFVALAALPSSWAEAGGSKPAPKPWNPTYTMLTPYAGQIAVNMFRRESPAMPWAANNCSAPDFGAACNQPTISLFTEQQVMISFSIKNLTAPFRTWKNGTPTEMVVRLDYAPSAQVDRGWRKKNQAYPGCGFHAKWTLATIPFNATGSAVWSMSEADEVTDAILYPEVCVICTFDDGSTDYCQCNRLNVAGTNLQTIETTVSGSIPDSMRAAAIAMSVFSPMFLIIYTIGDTIYYKKTGKSLRLAH